MKKIVPTLVLILITFGLFSQTDDILMTIDGRDITAGEFERVYNKNNNITPNTEQKSVDDYIDLFINYKLKVIESENKGYDTMKTFLDEFNGYTKQLAKPYLQNKEIKDKLVQEAYERSLYEIDASHILIRVDENSSPGDTLKAYNKARAIYSRIKAGEPFEEVAKATSDDPTVKENVGKLGYFSVFRMVYPFESAAYNTPVNDISKPVRTKYGYHIVKVHDKRPTKGSVEVAHIMTRISKDASGPEVQAAEEKINKAYHELMGGANWEETVAKYSEHQRTKEAGGKIGWLKTGQAPAKFMDACFEKEAGDFTKPIRTQGGFHIAKILDKKTADSFEESKEKLSNRIDNDAGRRTTIQTLKDNEFKAKYGFKQFGENTTPIRKLVDSSIYEVKWDATVAKDLNKPIVKIGDIVFTQYDLAIYISKLPKIKTVKKSIDFIVSEAMDDFASEKLNEYAMEQLPVENVDYKNLLQEYHDGILLFNLTNDMVWKRAQEDSSGLENFYKTTAKYKWEERIEVKIYKYTNKDFSAKLPKLAKKQNKKNLNDTYIFENLCQQDSVPCVTISNKTYEKGQDAIAEKLNWSKGAHTVLEENDDIFFYYVTNTYPVKDKKLNEARGLYIADYQSYLEDKWITELREKYPVKINEDVLKTVKENNK
jgi:peptidyl-prolyl cis-trans isomerase SurA